MTTTMNHNIQTSTSAIGNFVYHGLYETVLGNQIGAVPYDKRDDANDEIGGLYVVLLTDVFNNDIFCDMINDCDDNFFFKYHYTSHPQYYNFETDSIVFSFGYTDELKDAMYNKVKGNKVFTEFLADHFTSYDGFVSFTPNNWSEWCEGWHNDDWRCVSAMLWFLLDTEVTNNDKDSYWYDFNEQADEIILEYYLPYEYAVKFNNGYIAVAYHDYDNDNDCTIYHGYLIDNDQKVINTCDVIDEYDEDFHMSAFAALEYSNMIYDLTDGHKHGCGYHTTKCDVPNIKY